LTLKQLTKEAEKICEKVKNNDILGEYFTHNNPWANRPWKEFNYWNGWYALSKLWKPKKILEIGTGFGFSTIALAKGAGENLNLLVTIDLGNFLGKDNISFAKKGTNKYKQENNLSFISLFFKANTQPPYVNKKNESTNALNWINITNLCWLIYDNKFDLILIDGKHTEAGLYNDLATFFPHGNSQSLIVCDDLQHPEAKKSFEIFKEAANSNIKEADIWDFLTCNYEYAGSYKRIQGLIAKC